MCFFSGGTGVVTTGPDAANTDPSVWSSFGFGAPPPDPSKPSSTDVHVSENSPANAAGPVLSKTGSLMLNAPRIGGIGALKNSDLWDPESSVLLNGLQSLGTGAASSKDPLRRPEVGSLSPMSYSGFLSALNGLDSGSLKIGGGR